MRKLFKKAVKRAISAVGYTLVPLPRQTLPAVAELTVGNRSPVGTTLSSRLAPSDQDTTGASVTNGERFAEVEALLAQVTPWSGDVPPGYEVDFLGILTDGRFLWNKQPPFGGKYATTQLPTLANSGEGWFEIADWFYSARDAQDQYVAISLGAAYGVQLVGAWKALQYINPLPARLVGVEPVTGNCHWMRKHFANNGIDPEDYSIIQASLSVDYEPVLFPVGAPGTGLTASVQTNSTTARQTYADLFQRSQYSDRLIRNIMLYNSTGTMHDLGLGYSAELKFVSAVMLRDLVWPFERIDLLEVDIQQAEAQILPPCIDMLNRRVRRVHLGTHGRDIHAAMRELFVSTGWDIIFDFDADTSHLTKRGPLDLGDGILSARNPRV